MWINTYPTETMRKVSRHYNLEEPPKYSISRLASSRKKIRKIIIEDLILKGGPISSKDLLTTAAFLNRNWLSSPDDYINPVDELDDRYDDFKDDITDTTMFREEQIARLLKSFVPMEYDDNVIRDICVLLSGWEEDIRKGIPIHTWDVNKPIWAPVYFAECYRDPSKEGKKYVLSMYSLAGPTSTTKWYMTCSPARLQAIMRDIQLPRYEEHRDDDIGGMMGTVAIKRRGKDLVYDYFHVSSSQQLSNRTLYKSRKAGCPGNFPPYKGKQCRTCPVGRKDCSISRISETYDIQRECPNGHLGLYRNLGDIYCFFCVLRGLNHNKGT